MSCLRLIRSAAAAGMVLLVIASGTTMPGCSAASRLQSRYGNKFRYTYRLVAPASAKVMTYIDNRVAIVFRIDAAGIRFLLQNRSPEPLELGWKRASIGIKGRFSPVRNTQTLYLPPASDPGPLAVPPRGYVVDLAIPEQHVSFDGVSWREQDLFPTTDGNSPERARRIRGNVGSTLDFQLPIQFGRDTVEYAFRFVVTSVDSLPWKDYRKPRRPSPPPYPRASFNFNSPFVTAVTVAVLAGTVVYFVTQKKAPPSE
jgi:hypothetical protein